MNILGSGSGAARSLIIRFVADTARATSNIDALIKKTKQAQDVAAPSGRMNSFNRAMSGISETAAKAGQEVKNTGRIASETAGSFDRLGDSSYSVLGIFSKLGPAGIAVGAAFVVLSFILKETFNMGNLVESAMVQLEVLTGSAEKARIMMNQALRYSLITPFTPSQVFSATAAATQYNIKPFQKGAYGMKKDQTAMQIFAGLGSFRDIHGEAMGIERATHAVLRGDYRLLRPYRGLVAPAFETAKKAGNVGTPAFAQTFLKELSKLPQIMEMAEKHSESMVGMWSTIKGFWEEFWVRFSGAMEKPGILTFWSQIKDILRSIRDTGIDIITFLTPGFVELGASFGARFKFVWDIMTEMWRLLEPVLLPILQTMWHVFRAMLATFMFVLKTIIQIVGFVVDLRRAFFDVLDSIFGVRDVLAEMVRQAELFVLWLQVTFMFFGIGIKGLFDEWVSNFQRFLDWIVRSVEKFFNVPAIKKLWSGMGIAGNLLKGGIQKGAELITGNEDDEISGNQSLLGSSKESFKAAGTNYDKLINNKLEDVRIGDYKAREERIKKRNEVGLGSEESGRTVNIDKRTIFVTPMLLPNSEISLDSISGYNKK